MTAALGLLYKEGAWSASLISKYTGDVRQADYDPAKPAAFDFYRTAGYSNTDLSVAYRFVNPGAGIKTLKLQLNIFNLADRQGFTQITPGKTAPFDQVVFQAPRSVQVSARADF